jgi:hypothetical protein
MAAKPPPARRPIPLATKLKVALKALGVTEDQIDWSHEPALALRMYNDFDYEPPQHDPAYIVIRSKADHARITFKDNGTGRGDLTAIAHSKRVTRKHEEFRRRLLAKGESNSDQPKRKWPSRPLRSRNTWPAKIGNRSSRATSTRT